MRGRVGRTIAGMDARRLATASVLLATLAALALGATPAAARPSVVVIMTDDQTVAEMDAMPKTRRYLGRGGVLTWKAP